MCKKTSASLYLQRGWSWRSFLSHSWSKEIWGGLFCVLYNPVQELSQGARDKHKLKKSVTAVQEIFSFLVSGAWMMLETFSLSWWEKRDLWRFVLYPLQSNTRVFRKGKGTGTSNEEISNYCARRVQLPCVWSVDDVEDLFFSLLCKKTSASLYPERGWCWRSFLSHGWSKDLRRFVLYPLQSSTRAFSKSKRWAQATRKSVTAVKEDFSLLVSRAWMKLKTFSLSWLEQRDLWRFVFVSFTIQYKSFHKGKGWAQATKKSVSAVQEEFSFLVSGAWMKLKTLFLPWLEQRDL